MIRPLILTCLALMPATQIDAQSPAEADVLPRIIDHGCFDLIDDLNGCEQVTLLINHDGGADLYIHSDRRSVDGSELLAHVPNAAFNGAMFGMSPRLEMSDGGSLLLHSENIGIGRNAWTATATIAWRGGQFVVAGQTHDGYDRITNNSIHCDVNFRTGDFNWEVVVNAASNDGAEPVAAAYSGADRTEAIDIPLSSLSAYAPLTDVCDPAFDLYYSE